MKRGFENIERNENRSTSTKILDTRLPAARIKATFTLLLITVMLSLSLLSCEKKKSEPTLAPVKKDEASGERFWKRITEESNYREYSYWPGHEGMQPGQAPHGVFHKVFINKTLREALPVEDRIAPEGSIVVKENYNADKKLTSITLMAKVKGFSSEYGDWFWANYTPEGKVKVAGEVSSCISCHEGKRDNDYIIIKPLDKALPSR